jgi:2,3-bisphosphoglycerate-dependent phosphoglycerate mutase
MVKRLLAWIRHGEYAQPPGVPSAHLPHGLTSRGREQARGAGRAVWQYASEHGLKLDPVIDCSRMLRAWETASLLAEELFRLGGPVLQVEEFADLAERSLGAAANLTVEEIEAVLAADPRFRSPAPGWKRDPHYILPLQGAESLAQAGERVARHVIARLPAGASGASLKLFVGHGGAFRHAARLLGSLSVDDVQSLSMHNGAPIYFEHQLAESQTPDAPGACLSDRLVRVAGEWRQRSDTTPLD